jgi:hypothetical protein
VLAQIAGLLVHRLNFLEELFQLCLTIRSAAKIMFSSSPCCAQDLHMLLRYHIAILSAAKIM